MAADTEGYAEAIGYQLLRLQRLRERTLAQISSFKKGDLELSSYTCLFQIISNGPMRSGALADALLSDPSTVSRQVAQLVGRGLLERQADPADGRASVLAATEAGHAMADQMRRRRNSNLGRVISDWTPDDQENFVRLFDKFLDGYERCRPEMIAALRENLVAAQENQQNGVDS